jgi:DNA repair protein SbcD/Mre11
LRILHTSDWHLGQIFMGKSRVEEHEAFLFWLLETIKEKQIEVLLVSGDIFDTGTPPNYALELYYNFLKELSSIKTLITTIITAGNHDSISTLKAPKQLLEVLNVHVITSGDEDENVIIPIYKNEDLKSIICAVPFLRDGVIRKSLGGETISQKEKLANSGIKAYYENCYKKALELKKDKQIPIISMGHLTTVGSRSSQSERDIYIGGTIDIGGDYLASMFDYVALGHLHINQIVGSSSHVRYCGSPIPLSFSESKNTQKVNLVSFETSNLEIEELEIPLFRKLLVIKGNYEVIKNELSKIEDKNSWIEVHIKDDNAMFVNGEIRELASKLELTLLAVKIDKSEKQLKADDLKVISLDELSVEQVFEKRLELEELEDKEFEKELLINFKQIVSKVQSL